MGDFGNLIIQAGYYISDPVTLFLMFVATFMGLTFGSIPGLTAMLGITLLIPITYSLPPEVAIGMLVSIHIGAMSGGAVSSILLNIPGTPSALVTTFDGYPMCQQGRGAEAMGWAATASTFGSLFSWVTLVFASTALAKVATSFSAPEYFALAILGLTIIVSVTSKDIIKGLSMAIFGMIVGFVGIDPIFGDYRFTFGSLNLMTGIQRTSVLLGIYSIPQIFILCNQRNTVKQINVKMRNFMPSPRKIWKAKVPLFLASIIGTIVGIIPATGAGIACFVSYDQCRRVSKNPETFGEGNYEGVIAAEAANNSVVGGALVPMLSLGIPGDAVTAIVLGGLILHGMQPGPRLFVEHPEFISGIFTAMLAATIMMYLIQLVGIKFFIKILSLPNNFLAGALVIITMIGSFAILNNFFDIIVTLSFGFFGYFLVKAKYLISPFTLGCVLGALTEAEFRISLRLFSGDWTVFFTRPISCSIIVFSVVLLIFTLMRDYMPLKKKETT